MSDAKRVTSSILAVPGGFILSFLGLGVLWAGTPWPYQFLMFFAFLLLALGIRRWGGTALPMLMGAAPIGALLVQFRDKDNSHLMPVLLVASWVAGTWLGHHLGGRRAAAPGADAAAPAVNPDPPGTGSS